MSKYSDIQYIRSQIAAQIFPLQRELIDLQERDLTQEDWQIAFRYQARFIERSGVPSVWFHALNDEDVRLIVFGQRMDQLSRDIQFLESTIERVRLWNDTVLSGPVRISSWGGEE